MIDCRKTSIVVAAGMQITVVHLCKGQRKMTGAGESLVVQLLPCLPNILYPLGNRTTGNLNILLNIRIQHPLSVRHYSLFNLTVESGHSVSFLLDVIRQKAENVSFP